MTFVKGQSGNPAGRPLGCKNKINREFDLKMLEKTDYLADNLFKLFSIGNPTALRLVTQRMSPVSKGRPIEIDLPPLNSPADRPAAMEAIRVALCGGEIAIEEACGLIGYVDKALGYDHVAVAKGQLVVLMREVVGLRSEVALMAARLDAELGPDRVDNTNAESSEDDGPWFSEPEQAAAYLDKIKAESTIDPPAAEVPAADAPAADAAPASQDCHAHDESSAGIDQINAESIADAEPVSSNGHANGQNRREPGWERARHKLAPFAAQYAAASEPAPNLSGR